MELATVGLGTAPAMNSIAFPLNFEGKKAYKDLWDGWVLSAF